MSFDDVIVFSLKTSRKVLCVLCLCAFLSCVSCAVLDARMSVAFSQASALVSVLKEAMLLVRLFLNGQRLETDVMKIAHLANKIPALSSVHCRGL